MLSVYIESICLGLKLFTLGCLSTLQYCLKEFLKNAFLSPLFPSTSLFSDKIFGIQYLIGFNFITSLEEMTRSSNRQEKALQQLEDNSCERQQKDFRGQFNGYQRKEPQIIESAAGESTKIYNFQI